MNARRMGSLTCLVVGLAACGHDPVHLRLSRDLGASFERADPRIPLRAGLYVDEGARNLKLIFKPYKYLWGDELVGDLLVHDSETMLGSIFEQVVVLDAVSDPSRAGGEAYDVVVSPHVVKWYEDFHQAPWGKGEITAEVTIRWNVVSRDGEDIYHTSVHGIVTRAYTYGESGSTKGFSVLLQEVTGQVLADAFQKSAADLHSSAWWKTRWWKSGE